MNTLQWNQKEEINLTRYIIERISSRATGRMDDECLRDFPRDVYFVGNLRPTSEEFETSVHIDELKSKMSPVAFGAEFLIQTNEIIEIDISLHWSCYYRIFPTFEQQCQRQDLHHNSEAFTVTESEEKSSEDNNELETNEDNSSSKSDKNLVSAISRDRLFIRFKKIACKATGTIHIRRSGNSWETNIEDVKKDIEKEVQRAQTVACNDPNRIRTNSDISERVRVPNSALSNEAEYISFLSTLSNEIIPKWSWDIRTDIRIVGNLNNIILEIEFINTTLSVNSPNVETYFFDTWAAFDIKKSHILPFELNLAPKGFRYDRSLWGKGFNCAVEQSIDSSTGFFTTHIPIYEQKRYITRDTPIAPFKDLAQDPIPILDNVLNSMKEYIKIWIKEKEKYLNSNSTWDHEYGAEFEKDYQQFISEISIFEKGFQLIKNNNDIRLAFQLTNDTFSNVDPNKTSWRLFQLVFIVSQISGIASLASIVGSDVSELQKVDILYFPTGGGKTEAYLGVMIFHCFFDRLRGKTAGVTAWTRFPLRLLTLQQTQRVANVIGIAELIRTKQKDKRLSGKNVDGFAVGYFVGAEATPNEISPPYNEDMLDPVWSQANDPIARQKWKRIVRCPSCKTTSIQIDFDLTNVKIIHKCTNHNCAFPNGVVPVYVVDNEIYRYLPSIIVGTIDKLASLGNQRKMSIMLGKVDGRCSTHGYYKINCCQKGCNNKKLLQKVIPDGLTGPTLFIQDELHLIKEGLGTFDSHYETFLQRILLEFGNIYPLKIIASSATIEAFERQVEHLYGRKRSDARVFPGQGPTLGNSFYAETIDIAQRLYVGILPHNKTIFNSILELIEYYHREIQNLQGTNQSTNPYGGRLLPGSTEYCSLLDLYTTTLTYFLAGHQLNSIRTDIEGDVNPNLHKDGLSQLNISELTGSTMTDDVTRILDNLERPAPLNALHDSVLATSMVSHGVDVDRLNAMIFYGMPRQNAEYIQASSRVGRTHTGIVFCCLHPIRERDQSHYYYFKKYHEFLGQLVEPVAINRWSKFSIDRTLPGLFMSILLQCISNNSGEKSPGKYYMLDFVKQKISDGTVSANNFITFLEEAYKVEAPVNIHETAFRDEIRTRVQQFLDQIINSGTGETFVSEVLIPRPLYSLRDVDEPIEIELDSTGTQWARRTK